MADVTVYDWNGVPATGDAAAQRQEIAGRGAALRLVTIRAGTVAARHSHPHEQFVHVLSGTGRLDCAIGTVALAPGTVLHLASDAWHSAVFDTDTVLLEVNLREG